jgi:surfeit locus 1 family protein
MTPRTRAGIVLLAALLGLALTARLGVWQLDRAAQKVAAAAAVEAQGQLLPLRNVDLADLTASADAQLNRRVILRGHWLADKTVFLDNRPMDGRVGFFVLTPLQLEGRPEAVLVQRGWVPRNSRDRENLPQLDTPTALIELEGRLTASPSRLYEFSASPTGAIRQNVTVAAFAEELRQPMLPLTVLQQGSASEGLLRDWPPADLGLQKHYGYAFQWFALAALILGLYVWFQLVKPRRTTRTRDE